MQYAVSNVRLYLYGLVVELQSNISSDFNFHLLLEHTMNAVR